ncbi:Cupredoxin, partial [Mycena polygramma]
AIGPTADLTLSNGDVSPDSFTRQAVLVNGQTPGPLITGNKGDEFDLNVIDQLSNETMLLSTSIHWHGFFQPNNSWADGVAFVTQCPIAVNNSFEYTFPTNAQAGTFWYHSHLCLFLVSSSIPGLYILPATQYCDGLRGPLVGKHFLYKHLVLEFVDSCDPFSLRPGCFSLRFVVFPFYF